MKDTTYDIALIGTHFLAQALKEDLNKKGFSVALLEVFNHEENYFEFFYGLENIEAQKKALLNFESILDCKLFDAEKNLSVSILENKNQGSSPLWESYAKGNEALSLDKLVEWTSQKRQLNRADTFSLVQIKKEKKDNTEESFFKVNISSDRKEIFAKNIISLNSLQSLDNFCSPEPELVSFSKSLKPFLYTAITLKFTHSQFKGEGKKDLHVFQNKNFHHCVGRFKEGESYWTCFIPFEDFEFDASLSMKAMYYLKNRIKVIYPNLLDYIDKERVIVETSLYSNKFFKGFSAKKTKLVLDSQNFINESCKKENKNLFFAVSSKIYPENAFSALWTSFKEVSDLVYK